MASHFRWLENEIGLWQQEGLVDGALAARLRARYAGAAATATPWGRVIFGSLGALLLGLGIIALLAANWGGLPRSARAVIAFLPLACCAVLYAAGVWRGWTSRAFLEPLGVFWGLAVGAGIALIAQTYHLPGDAGSFALAWTLLLLPVCYVTRAVAPVVGYVVGLLVWASVSQLAAGVGLWYWPLAAAVVPVIGSAWHEPHARVRANLMLWGAALCSTAALGVTLEKSLPGLWMIIYTSAFAVLFLAGLACERDGESLGHTPLRTLGGGGLAVTLFLLIFKWPWREVGWNHWRDGVSFHKWAAVFDFALAVALPLAAAWLLVVAGRRQARRAGPGLARVPAWAAWGVAPFVTAGVYAAAAQRVDGMLPSLLMAVYLAVLGLATLVEGLANGRPRLVNGGVLVLLAVILGKFFGSDAGFTAKGLAFIVCGCLFLSANLLYSRRLRRRGGAA